MNAHRANNVATVLKLNSILNSKRLDQVKEQEMVGFVGDSFCYAEGIPYVYLLVQVRNRNLIRLLREKERCS